MTTEAQYMIAAVGLLFLASTALVLWIANHAPPWPDRRKGIRRSVVPRRTKCNRIMELRRRSLADWKATHERTEARFAEAMNLLGYSPADQRRLGGKAFTAISEFLTDGTLSDEEAEHLLYIQLREQYKRRHGIGRRDGPGQCRSRTDAVEKDRS